MNKKVPEHLKGFLNSTPNLLRKERNKKEQATYEHLKWDGGVTIKNLVKNSYEIAQEKGWWDQDRDVPHILALVHSEVSEALEAYRESGANETFHRLTDNKPEGLVYELADVLIRVADLAGKYNLDLETAVREKTKYNSQREYRHGGKKA